MRKLLDAQAKQLADVCAEPRPLHQPVVLAKVWALALHLEPPQERQRWGVVVPFEPQKKWDRMRVVAPPEPPDLDWVHDRVLHRAFSSVLAPLVWLGSWLEPPPEGHQCAKLQQRPFGLARPVGGLPLRTVVLWPVVVATAFVHFHPVDGPPRFVEFLRRLRQLEPRGPVAQLVARDAQDVLPQSPVLLPAPFLPRLALRGLAVQHVEPPLCRERLLGVRVLPPEVLLTVVPELPVAAWLL